MIKNTTILILFIAVVILLYLQKCSGNGDGIISIKTDTVWVHEKKDTQYIPQIVNHYLPGKASKPFEKWDTLYLTELKDVDTAAILQDYFSFNTYADTLKNKYGYVLVSDTITRNKIAGRGVETNLLVPEVTKTITLTQPKRNQVYAGFGLFGNSKDFAGGYELNLSLKTKQDRILGVGYDQFFNGGGYFKIEYRHKIIFKKP